MLIQFSIENHRSIKDSAVISFAASKDKSLESYLLHPDEKRALLPAIAIYGANAAGKSNVLHALVTPQCLHPLRSCSFIKVFGMLTAFLLMPRRSIRSIYTIGRTGARH